MFSYGFRPFFLGAGVWAAFSMTLWLMVLSGHAELASAFDPISWHAHEFLFGYLGAVLAGFLLTAMPNWTGRPPIVGQPLIGLFLLWLLGRVAILFSIGLPPVLVALADIALPVALIAVLAREIIISRNWRNLVVLAMIGVLTLGNVLFHTEAAVGDFAAQGYGFRIGLSAAVMMIAVIGGRIVPAFTRNWLIKRAATSLPPASMGAVDRIALVTLLVALLAWIAIPHAVVTGWALALSGLLGLTRLYRWKGTDTASEPLVLILHIGFGFIPVGALVLAAAILVPDMLDAASAQHLWMAGGIGTMTLAVMTRATLGHTGHALAAGVGTITVYGLILTAVALRLAVGWIPSSADLLYSLSGLCWILGYACFVLLYGPHLVRRPAD